jgi:thiosulfate/3-mercaptopyruvate sulfurtransferase
MEALVKPILRIFSTMAGLSLLAGPLLAQNVRPPANPLVTTEWLAGHLTDPGLVILQIDGRRDAYTASHIPGAQFVIQDDIAVDGENNVGLELPPVPAIVDVLRKAGVADGRHIIVYSANPLAATRLWLTLDYIGLADQASILDGGFIRWKAESRPVTTEVAAVKPATLTAHPRRDMVVQAEWVRDRLEDPKTLLIDARPDDEYTGADGGMGGMAHPGHIPGAFQMYWEQLIQSRQSNPSFLPREQLHAKFALAGADNAATVVSYCMIGARASLTYFVGRMLGYDMKFYDGSWHDWGTRDLPYVKGTSRR